MYWTWKDVHEFENYAGIFDNHEFTNCFQIYNCAKKLKNHKLKKLHKFKEVNEFGKKNHGFEKER